MADIRWSREALADLIAQTDELESQNPQAARRLLQDVQRLADHLAQFPALGRAIDGTGLRVLLTRSYRYRLVYRVAGDAVEVIAVLHPRQA
ncbi:type II toxin-antitoxin system RelE/ParE family toxin [Pseudoroseicyclus sp. CXY001]|uniref:type II toxin-antitoxin system RelE/ParE family toxin n=1 Tax=Pseudoroseicyclus sp. CXY001 TaxID=3242492 RepID=UPI0035712343